MKKSSIIINLPWSNNPATDIQESASQCVALFDVIVKMFWFKYKFETASECKLRTECSNYNLNDPRIFNLFVSEIIAKIIDPVAQTYAMKCLREIKNNNFKKSCVKNSYRFLTTMFNPESDYCKNLRNILANQRKTYIFVDFLELFEECNKTTISNALPEIVDLKMFYRNKMLDKQKV